MPPVLPALDGAVCECSECAAYGPPARKPQLGKHGSPVAWRGRWYHRMPHGHYRHAKGMLLHRAIWIAHNGPIPDGLLVHHVNECPGDNRLGNFALVAPSEHRFEHPQEYGVARRQHHAEQITEWWAGYEGREYTCTECSKPFRSRNMRAKRCGRQCHLAWRRRTERARVQPDRG